MAFSAFHHKLTAPNRSMESQKPLITKQHRRLCELAEVLAHLQVDIVALSQVRTPRIFIEGFTTLPYELAAILSSRAC